jgi:hypothetical protein
MDSDDRLDSTRQFSTLSMGQTLTTPLNNTVDFLVSIIINQTKFFIRFFSLQGIENNLGQTTVGYEQMLDETTRECKSIVKLLILYSFFLIPPLSLHITISIYYIIITTINTIKANKM